MASKGRGRRGHPRGDGRPPPIFYQQAFIEAMGAAIATAKQAKEARGQGGASNLQRFKAHHPPTFRGGGDLMVADHGSVILRGFSGLWRSPRILLGLHWLHSSLRVSPKFGGSGSRLPRTQRL